MRSDHNDKGPIDGYDDENDTYDYGAAHYNYASLVIIFITAVTAYALYTG